VLSRRGLLAAGLSVAIVSAGCSESSVTDTPAATETEPNTDDGTDAVPGSLRVGLDTVTDVPTAPLAFRATSDGRAYVADRPGRVYLLADGTVETALELSDSVVTGSERGLLGLALHPDFASNDRLYVRYSSRPRSGTPTDYSHTFVLAEFRARADGTVDAASERTLLEIPQPQGNHNSGPIAFGPDGYLYIGVGDGGAGGDVGSGHVEDWYEPNDGGNGQDVTENLLGSLLRLDVDARPEGRPYGIPADNPLVGKDGRGEHYAWGLRNPWGISFDGADLYVADVGQSRYEEVNLVVKGGNYGWNVAEGTHCYRTDRCPETAPGDEPLKEPVIEYPHGGAEVSGVAVVGGHVYRGAAISGLSGMYVFGDLNAEGQLFVASPADSVVRDSVPLECHSTRASAREPTDMRPGRTNSHARPYEGGLWPTGTLPVENGGREKLGQLLALSRDRTGELYALTSSGVHRIVPTA
jgi:glucose/arabinose dehydrogenase